jgi:hypothetical protein
LKRRRAGWQDRVSRAPGESRDKMARNLNTRERGVTGIMRERKDNREDVLSGQVGDSGGPAPLVSQLTQDRGDRSGLLTHPIRQ